MRILDDASTSVSYAGFWKRAIAYVIDSMIVLVPLLTAADALVPDLIANREDGRLHLIVLPVMFFYWSAFESSRWQATPAKRWLGIVVTHVDGDRLSFGRAAARWLAKILSSIAFLGYAIAAFTERKQALHDFLVHSVVVKGRM